MMNQLATIFLVFTTLTCFSQAEEQRHSPWRVGLIFSPDFYLTSSNVSTGFHIRHEIEPLEFTFTTGIISLFAVTPALDIGAGLAYSKKDYSGTISCHVCDFGFKIEPQTAIRQRFVEIPLFIRYGIINNRVGLHIEAGMTSSYLTGDIRTQYYEEELPSTKSFLLSGHLGLGLEMALREGITLGLTPIYRRSLTDFYEESGFKFQSLGITTGVIYQIKK